MREITSSTKATANSDQPGEKARDITIKIDGREVTFRGPTSSQFSMMIYGLQGQLTDVVATFINFFFVLLKDPEDRQAYKRRLWDPEDEFDDETVAETVKALIEEWAGRPIQLSTDSSALQPTGGQTLTATTQDEESTRSAFGLTDS
jgi:hypothetical protein